MAANLEQIGARFSFYLKIKELGIYEIAVLTGASPGQISNIVAGKNYTMDELLKVLTGLKELNAHWIIYGEGNMFKQSGQNGPILPDKRHQHLLEVQQLLEKLDQIERSKANRNQIEELRARIAALTTQL